MSSSVSGTVNTKGVSNILPFPLPRASQQCYSKWYNTVVDTGALNGYKILWVGSQLACRFKSESIHDNVGPHNVFILKNAQIHIMKTHMW